jgi:hypothetical protein
VNTVKKFIKPSTQIHHGHVLFLFCAAKMKKNQKEKSSSLKTIRALRFSLMAGLSELGLLPSPQTGRQAHSAINCDAH